MVRIVAGSISSSSTSGGTGRRQYGSWRAPATAEGERACAPTTSTTNHGVLSSTLFFFAIPASRSEIFQPCPLNLSLPPSLFYIHLLSLLPGR